MHFVKLAQDLSEFSVGAAASNCCSKSQTLTERQKRFEVAVGARTSYSELSHALSATQTESLSVTVGLLVNEVLGHTVFLVQLRSEKPVAAKLSYSMLLHSVSMAQLRSETSVKRVEMY
jgi:hypothetical protein